VPVDFERQSFSEVLLVAGFDRTRPTAWIWEGVTMYLSGPEVADSLDQMTDLSAPKSALLMTYRIPNSLPFGRLGKLVIPWVFAVGGEPLDATFEPSELDTWLAPAWTVEYDGDANDWRRFTAAPADPAPSFLAERLAVARRGP
jgi:methyltransferase (TIGR00027 family)